MRDEDRDRGLITAGYCTAVLLPVVGFVIGIVLLTRNRVRQGVTAMCVAVVVTVIGFAVVAALQKSDLEAAQDRYEQSVQDAIDADPTLDSDGDGEPDGSDAAPFDEHAQ